MRARVLILATALLIGAVPAIAQPRSPISVPQVPARATSSAASTTPVAGPPASASDRTAVPSVPAEIIEACRAAQAGDRPPPDGIDCMAAMQALAANEPPATAEGSLLQMFGLGSDVTGAPAAQAADTSSADAAARQLATGEVQVGTGSGAAAIVARDRGAPPPSAAPPGGGPR